MINLDTNVNVVPNLMAHPNLTTNLLFATTSTNFPHLPSEQKRLDSSDIYIMFPIIKNTKEVFKFENVKNFYFFAYAYVSSSKFVSFAITPPSNLYSDTLKLNTRLAIYSENELFTQTTYKIRFSNQARVEIVTASSTYNILSTETYEEGWKYISGALRFISYLGQTFLLSQITVDSFYTTNPQFKRYAITPASLSATYTPALITNTNIYHCAFLYS